MYILIYNKNGVEMNKERFNELLEKEKDYNVICKELESIMDSPVYKKMFAARASLIFCSILRALVLLRDKQDLKLNYDIFFEYFVLKNMKDLIKNNNVDEYTRNSIVSYISCLTDGTYHNDQYIYYDGSFHDDLTSQLKNQFK
jgi:hypothetical protein